MAQVRVRKRGKTFSYIFEAGKVDGNIGITSESITLKDFMTAWLNEVIALNVKVSSMQLYQSLARNQIFPQLGGIKIQELTPAMLDKWIRGLQQAGLGQNTIRHARTLLRQALHYAVYPSQIISVNPADYIKVPKNAPKELVKRSIISPERFKKLLEKYSPDTDYYIPLLILYYTGVRCGELLGLTWDAINFTKKTITIDRQVVYLHSRGYFFSTPKTPTSLLTKF